LTTPPTLPTSPNRIAPTPRVLAALLCACMLAAVGVLAQSVRAGTTTRAGPTTRAEVASSAAPALHVSGSGLFTAQGRRVVLRGVNRAGGEYACVNGQGIWDGPMDQASVTAMKSWNVNAVRVPLNEACWNGESYVRPRYRGANYRRAVEAYVRLLNRNGIVAILDLHFTDGLYTGLHAHCKTTSEAVCQKPMPDAAQAIPFWTAMARAFKNNNAVIFDVFNEPFPERANGEARAWKCWLRGGSYCTGMGIDYQVAGMQSLVAAIRSTGARNVIILGGLAYADDLTGWLAHAPRDPVRDLAVSWHSYSWNACVTTSCWNSQVAPVIARVPVISGEIGESGCADTFVDRLARWLDAHSTGYLAWAWNADFDCSAGPSLITSYSGSPTPYGAGFRSHLISLR
jgi:endoglucanase